MMQSSEQGTSGRMGRTFLRRSWLGLVLAGCLGVGLCSSWGCGPPFGDVLVNDLGDEVRLEGVLKVLQDPELSDEEKRDGLNRLGITDDTYIDALLQASA